MVSPICFDTLSSQSRSDAVLVVDQFQKMLLVEQKYKVPHIPCRAHITDGTRHPYGDWRRKICQWSFKVIDHFKIDREVVSCAMNIFDRYLASGTKSFNMDVCPCPECQRTVDSRTFQLTAMTSLYLAMKISDSGDDHSSTSRKVRLSSFVELSRGQFCADDLTQMERLVLEELQWKVYPPTPMSAVSYLLRLMPSYLTLPYTCRKSYDLVMHVLHELARYLTELSVCIGSVCIEHTPSQVAYASILLSMELLTLAALPMHVRDDFNEAVVSTSAFSGGTILTPHDEAIILLQERLRQSFWPEMLFDDCDIAEIGHPISMAKDFGLLDVSCLSCPPPSTMYSLNPYKQEYEGSPVCVVRELG
jgi:hypothetical protein